MKMIIQFYFVVLIMIHYTSLTAVAQQDIFVTGIAEYSKAGAVVVTDEGQVYYIEGKNDWDKEKLHKTRIRVCGVLKRFHTSSDELGYDDKVYKQGIIGEQLVLSNAEWTTAAAEPENVRRDSMLMRLKQDIPENWTADFRSDTMTISRKETVYSLFENQINAPINNLTGKELEEKIIKYGKVITPFFEFLIVPRFSDREIKAALKMNQIIQTATQSLPKKHNIAHIAVHRKGITYYSPKTDDEKKAVEAYESELADLQKKIIPLPDFHAELFSLFLLKQIGIADEYTLIHPESATGEMWKIKNEVIARILKKY